MASIDPPDPTPIDWVARLRALRGSNPAASRHAADAFRNYIRGTLRRLGAFERSSDWEDLIQDVLVKLVEKADTLTAPLGWLDTVTHHAYIDWHRKQKSQSARVQAFGELHEMLRQGEPEDHPFSWVSKQQDLDRLRAAIARLPEASRGVMDRVYPRDPSLDVSTLEAVARELGVKLHTVKNRLRGASRRLTRELKREQRLGPFRRAEAKAAPRALAHKSARHRQRASGSPDHPRTQP